MITVITIHHNGHGVSTGPWKVGGMDSRVGWDLRWRTVAQSGETAEADPAGNCTKWEAIMKGELYGCLGTEHEESHHIS